MTRVLVLADIHSNLVALDAVLTDAAGRSGFDAMWVLGDTVGYGPEPAACIARVQEYEARCVAGNHDLGATGAIGLGAFNPEAAQACRWTQSRLGRSELGFLEGLPLEQVESSFLIVHGSPREPVWEYVMSASQAGAAMRELTVAPNCLVGHTHVPAAFRLGRDRTVRRLPTDDGAVIALGDGSVLINPGAVGQPRDGDPRASYAMYDGHLAAVSFHRVAYDVQSVADAIVARGLPARLGTRLHLGY